MKKKLVALLLTMTMGIAVLSGCSSSPKGPENVEAPAGEQTPIESTDESTEKPVDPTEVVMVFADGDEAHKTSIYKIVDMFNESQENYKIGIEAGSGGNYNEFLKTKESVGEFPDIVEMRDTAQYVRAGMMEPMSDELQKLFINTTEFGGKVYTAPLSGENTQGLMYNKKYFKDNNINEEPKTWDEFLEICQQIKDLGEMSPLVVGGNDLWHMGFWFNKIYTDEIMPSDDQFIASLYEGKTTWKDTPEATSTFEKMIELFTYVDEGWGSTPDAMITTFLVTDMAAMLFSGTHMFSQIMEADPDFELGWMPLPDSKGKYNLVGGAGLSGWALSSKAAQEPGKKEAYEEFVKFFFSPEVYGIYCEALSSLPTTIEAPKMEVNELLQAVIDATSKADDLSQMWNGKPGNNELPPDYRNFTYKVLVEVLQGTKTIESALNEMDEVWVSSTVDFNPVKGIGLE